MNAAYCDDLIEGMEAALREERADLDITKIIEAARLASSAVVRRAASQGNWDANCIEHRVQVGMLVARAGLGVQAVMSAILQGVVGEGGVTLDELHARFGAEVADLVDELTEKSGSDGSAGAARSSSERGGQAMLSAAAKSIKYADTMTKARFLVAQNSDMARKYVEEERELLKGMVGGNATLLVMAVDCLEAAADRLGQ